MKIFIPMAGNSRRFKAVGYNDPKPFIAIDGKSMIARVCEMFDPRDEFVFICNADHLKCEQYRNILESTVKTYTIIPIEPHEEGPVYSVLQAEKAVKDNGEPLIMSYCDFTMCWNYQQFKYKMSQHEGGLAVFKGFHPASFGNTLYAYVKENQCMEMVELREKRSFTNDRVNEFASTGVYYIDSWIRFKKYAQELLRNKDKVATEYYCSYLYNYLVRDHLKVGLFEVENFICWGTPEDLREYLFWSEYFAKDLKKMYAKES